MANRSTRFILKNNANSSAPFSGATLLAGEPIVNTAAGIMMFSGVTTGGNDWVPAGPNGNGNFFEVGSNLYNLKIRNKITSYSGLTNLSGLFLSGTTDGFVLAPISTITGVDTYVTGFTYNDNILTIKQNVGQADLTALINTMTGLTVNGTLIASTISATTYQNLPTDIRVTGATYTDNTFTYTNNTGGTFSVLFNTMTGLTVNGTLSATTSNFGTANITTLNVTGGSITTSATNPNDIVNYSTLTGYSQSSDIYVTGGTVSYTGPNGSLVLGRRNSSNVTITGLTDVFVTGGTYNAGTTTFTNNSGGTFTVTGLSSTDTFVTGYTYSPTSNTFTIKQNQGKPDLTALIDTMSGLTVNGLLSATTISGDTIYAVDFPQLPYTDNETVEVYSASGDTFLRVKDVVSAPSGGTRVFVGNINVTSGLTINGTVSSTSISATTYLNLPPDIRVTGGTMGYVGSAGTATFTNSTGGTFNVTGFKDVFTTGGTYNAGTATFNNNDGTTYQLTGLTSTDIYVTGFTYNPTSNLITLSQNQGQIDKTLNITSMSGLTLTNLTAGRVPYVGAGGLLTDEAGFTYNDSTNVLSIPADGTMNVGTGGLNVAGDAVIQGTLTVFGPSISAFTNELYVEDSNISLNYNPTGNTTITSLGAGWMIQDGNGVNGGNVNLNINRLDTLTGLTVSDTPSVTEYTSATGYANRGWVTQLNDIVIRSTNVNTPNGVRVLTEFDILDGGSF